MPSWWNKAEAANRTLKITASSSYDLDSAKLVPVNSEKPLHIACDYADIEVLIRIKEFVGSDAHSSDPATSPYFESRAGTNISIQVNVTPKEDIDGDELIFGNDFGYPIRDFLPYGTSTGLKLFQRYVDPSVKGDLYIEQPFLYGKALSSFNLIKYEEDIEVDGKSSNGGVYRFIKEDSLQKNDSSDDSIAIPLKAEDRQRFFQDSANLKQFTLKKGKHYLFDFFSGLVSLENSQFNINLPGGFELNLSRYVNEKFNTVRYVLKKQSDPDDLGVDYGEPLLVINFEIVAAVEVSVEVPDDTKQDADDADSVD